MPLDPIRAKLRVLMEQTLLDEREHLTWTYHEVRPLSVPASWRPGQKVYADCSKGVQFLCKWAGAPDPMNMGYGVYGNLTSGPNGDEHAAMVLEPGADPLLWSDGHQGAPNSYRLSYDRREHQFLRLILPVHVPTAAEKLRAMKGYWSWLQWKLGEGDWHGYQQADNTVRPNVPRVIPPAWWRRYAAFLLNRKKGNQAKGPTG